MAVPRPAPASAPPFDPLQLPVPPSLWYRASDILTASPLNPLNDAEGWPSHLVGGTKLTTVMATAPTYVGSGGATPGSLPAVSFNGTNQFCSVPSPGAGVSPWTFYFVLSNISLSGERRIFDTFTGRLLFKQRNGSGLFSYANGASEHTYGAESTAAQILAISLSATGVIVRRNGVTLTPGGTPTYSNKAISGTTNLGASITPSTYFSGRMSEWLAIPAAHDLATIQQMEAYLDGIYPLLP